MNLGDLGAEVIKVERPGKVCLYFSYGKNVFQFSKWLIVYLELLSSSVPQIINNNLFCGNVVGCLLWTENVSLDSENI